jgi:predicted nucleic acid-binding protein
VTVRAALDSNILVYAELEPESDKGRLARRIIEWTAPRGVLAAQALLEFLAVVRRRRPDSLAGAMAKAQIWSTVFEIAPTTDSVVTAASALVRNHHFQVWDAVIWSAAEVAGARLFLSEDLHDGLQLGAMRAINPFRADASALETLLKG